MKKIISSFLLAALLILPAHSLFAADGSTSFLNALSNFSKVEDYKMMQSFYGNAEFEEGEDHLNAKYRITVNTVVDDGKSLDNYNRINAYLKFTNLGAVTDSTPFKEMTVQASAEIISLNQLDLYGKLTSFNVSPKGALPFAITDIEDLKSMVNLYKGVWFHSGVEELTAESMPTETGATMDLEKYTAFEDQFKLDPKAAILGLSEMVLKDSETGMTEEEQGQALDGIKMLLEAKLFTVKEMAGSENNGFRFFNLNKASIVSFLQQFATLVGEELSVEDAAAVRSVLSKVSLSGKYRVEDVYGLIDDFAIRFKIRETGPMKNLELNYRYKVSDLNKANSIKVPTEFQELSAVTGASTDAGIAAGTVTGTGF
jgi:hypothetical protein